MASTIDEQIACVEREVKKRRQVYPRWVQQGKMSQAFADRQVEIMEDVALVLRGLKDMPFSVGPTVSGSQPSLLPGD